MENRHWRVGGAYPNVRKKLMNNYSGFRPNQMKKLESGPHLRLDIYTWDVERIGSADEVDGAIIQTLEKHPQIVCVQQANFPTSGDGTANYKWSCAGESGSAILVDKKSGLEVSNVEQICEEICIAEVSGSDGVKLKVISCYIPPSTEYKSVDLWSKLEEILKQIPTNITFVLAGDFNAQLGRHDLNEVDKMAIENSLFHEVCNDNGFRLKKLAREAHLKVATTCGVQRKDRDLLTFKDQEVKTQQDFILVPQLRNSYSHHIFTKWHKNYKHALHGIELTVVDAETFSLGKETEEQMKRPKMIISTWNVQGAAPAKVDSVLAEQGLPIVCVQDLFVTSDEEINTDNYTWYFSKKLWAKNVGILIKKSADITLTNFESISECLCTGDLVFRSRPFKLMSFYLPLPTDPRNEVVQAQLEDAVKALPMDLLYVIAGDFNTNLNQKELKEDENSDRNAVFVCKLAKERQLCLKTSLWKQFHPRQKHLFLCRVTETEPSMPHHVLLPLSLKADLFIRFFVKWVPFFNSGIFNVYLREQTPKDHQAGVAHTVNNEEKTELLHKMLEEEGVHGINFKTKVFEMLPGDSEDEEVSAEEAKSVSAEDLDKFIATPPTVKDLARILKDFVLYFPANRNSQIVTNPLDIISRSFRDGKFGKILGEYIEEMDDSSLKRRICRLRWNDILLSEYIGGPQEVETLVIKKSLAAFIAKLSQVFFTVKAKKSYFRQGLPILMGDPKLSEDLKMAHKRTFPTMEKVNARIDQFFSKDTYSELVFGPDFSEQERTEIKMYAKSKDLSYRLFKSSSNKKEADNLALFMKHTPQDLKKKLLKNLQDSKFYMIPPCGAGNEYVKFQQKWETDNLQREQSLLNRSQAKSQGNQREQVDGEGVIQNSGTNRNKRTLNKQDGPAAKQPRLDNSALPPVVQMPQRSLLAPLVLVWPLTIRSQLEDKSNKILEANFPIEFRKGPDNQVAAIVSLPLRNGIEKKFCIAKAPSQNRAASTALQLIMSRSTIIKPNPSYLGERTVPNFIRYKVPCQANPRTYIILTYSDTGPLSIRTIEEIYQNFNSSYNEDLFFDKDSYSFSEKKNMLDLARKFNLNVRHFGESPNIDGRYVCVYKKVKKNAILEEVLKMRGAHPKYMITRDRLPPRLGLNVF